MQNERLLKVLGNASLGIADLAEYGSRKRIYYIENQEVKIMEGYLEYDSKRGGYCLIYQVGSVRDNAKTIPISQVALITLANMTGRHCTPRTPIFETTEDSLREIYNQEYDYKWSIESVKQRQLRPWVWAKETEEELMSCYGTTDKGF